MLTLINHQSIIKKNMCRTFIKLNELEKVKKVIEVQKTVLASSLYKVPKVVEYSNINSLDEYLIKHKQW